MLKDQLLTVSFSSLTGSGLRDPRSPIFYCHPHTFNLIRYGHVSGPVDIVTEATDLMDEVRSVDSTVEDDKNDTILSFIWEAGRKHHRILCHIMVAEGHDIAKPVTSYLPLGAKYSVLESFNILPTAFYCMIPVAKREVSLQRVVCTFEVRHERPSFEYLRGCIVTVDTKIDKGLMVIECIPFTTGLVTDDTEVIYLPVKYQVPPRQVVPTTFYFRHDPESPSAMKVRLSCAVPVCKVWFPPKSINKSQVDLIKIEINYRDPKSSGKQTMTVLCNGVESRNCPPDVIMMTPLTFFNLTKGLICLERHWMVSISWQPVTEEKAPDLTRVQLALIPSPLYPNSNSYGHAVDSYMRNFITDMVCVDDIIAVPLSMSTTKPKQSALFKITRLEDDIVRGKFPLTSGTLANDTEIFVIGTCPSLVPTINIDTIRPVPFPKNVHSESMYTLKPYCVPGPNQINHPVLISLIGPDTSQQVDLVHHLRGYFNLNLVTTDINHLVMDSPAATEQKFLKEIEQGVTFSPCIHLMKNFHMFLMEGKGNEQRFGTSLKRMLRQQQPHVTLPYIIICTFSEDQEEALKKCPPLHSLFTHQIKIPEMTDMERTQFFQFIMDADPLTISRSVQASELALLTKSMSTNLIRSIIDKSRIIADMRVGHVHPLMKVTVTAQDMNQSLSGIRKRIKQKSGLPEIPNVKWEDVGGLEDVKQAIKDTIELPLRFPHLSSNGLKRGGILLYGPPGTGKTLIAKAVATECNINFMSVKGPELINMFVGESEQNVRDVFSRGRKCAPCVIFFDELDSLAPNRGKNGDSGGVMDRIVSQLLAEMDGVDSTPGLFIIGATNRPDLIDPALLRPGRLDKIIHVGICTDVEGRLSILKALTRKFNLETGLRLEDVESMCPPNFSGAQFYSLCSGAMNLALNRIIESIDSGSEADDGQDIMLTKRDFEISIESMNLDCFV